MMELAQGVHCIRYSRLWRATPGVKVRTDTEPPGAGQGFRQEKQQPSLFVQATNNWGGNRGAWDENEYRAYKTPHLLSIPSVGNKLCSTEVLCKGLFTCRNSCRRECALKTVIDSSTQGKGEEEENPLDGSSP